MADRRMGLRGKEAPMPGVRSTLAARGLVPISLGCGQLCTGFQRVWTMSEGTGRVLGLGSPAVSRETLGGV